MYTILFIIIIKIHVGKISFNLFRYFINVFVFCFLLPINRNEKEMELLE